MEDDKFYYYLGLGQAFTAACFEYYDGKIKFNEIGENCKVWGAVLVKDTTGIGFKKLCSNINMNKRSLEQALSEKQNNSNGRAGEIKSCFKYMEQVGGGYRVLGEFIEARVQAKDNIETILKQLKFFVKL